MHACRQQQNQGARIAYIQHCNLQRTQTAKELEQNGFVKD